MDMIHAIEIGDINLDAINMVESLGIKEYASICFFMFFVFSFFIVVSLLKSFYLTILYIGVRIAYKKYSKEKLDKIDFQNNSYYRDIIFKYSPAVLSYIDDFKLEEKDIVATLMSLELKQKLSMKDQIKIINDSEENLDENEKYIFKKLKNNTLKNINMLEFEEKVIKDCLDYNLLEENKDIKKKIIKKVIFSVCIYINCCRIFQLSNFL